MQFASKPFFPTSSKSLHRDMSSLFDSVRRTTDKHVSPYVFMFMEGGRGVRRQPEKSFLVGGNEFKMVKPAALASLQDLVMRVSNPVTTADAQAELTSLSAARLGVPDINQICHIAVDMGLLSAGRAGMLHDALLLMYCLFLLMYYLSTAHADGRASQGIIREVKRRKQGEGSLQEKAAFYASLAAKAEHLHEGREVRNMQVQQLVAESEHTGTAAQATRVHADMLAGRSRRKSSAPAEGGEESGSHGNNEEEACEEGAAPPPQQAPPSAADQPPPPALPDPSTSTRGTAGKKRGRPPKASGPAQISPPEILEAGQGKRPKKPINYADLDDGDSPFREPRPRASNAHDLDRDNPDDDAEDHAASPDKSKLKEAAQQELVKQPRDVNELLRLYRQIAAAPGRKFFGSNLMNALHNAVYGHLRDH